jgi:hypothetical protein
MHQERTSRDEGRERLLVARFEEEAGAERAVRTIVERDFPMDMLSVLGRGQSSGDDPLGLYYPGVGERMKGWGAMGAFWGGLWGLLSGAAGMFFIPGFGAVFAAGPIVEALAGALAGAGLGGGAMAGAAAASELSVAIHRSGVPEEKLDALHDAIEQGQTIVMLRLDADEVDKWRVLLGHAGAESMEAYPYRGLLDAV